MAGWCLPGTWPQQVPGIAKAGGAVFLPSSALLAAPVLGTFFLAEGPWPAAAAGHRRGEAPGQPVACAGEACFPPHHWGSCSACSALGQSLRVGHCPPRSRSTCRTCLAEFPEACITMSSEAQQPRSPSDHRWRSGLWRGACCSRGAQGGRLQPLLPASLSALAHMASLSLGKQKPLPCSRKTPSCQ